MVNKHYEPKAWESLTPRQRAAVKKALDDKEKARKERVAARKAGETQRQEAEKQAKRDQGQKELEGGLFDREAAIGEGFDEFNEHFRKQREAAKKAKGK